MRQKKVVAVHDISGLGKCSLTVALPIVSVAGLECCAIPTAVLSNHTGGFKDFTFKDLTEDILPIVNRFKEENIFFDTIYSGYLGSNTQVDILIEAIKQLKNQETLVVVDPVMGDNGSLYKTFSPEFPSKMRELCQCADVITPNMTEACLMLGESYSPPPYSKDYIDSLLVKLGSLCKKTVVLTGVSFDKKALGAAALEVNTGKISYCFNEKIEGMHHGTGDIFCSVLVSALTLGRDIAFALNAAVEFTCLAIENTSDFPELWYGVNFEGVLKRLPDILGGTNGSAV